MNLRYAFMRFPQGKPKAVTLSYDDGAYTDMRLIETLDKYGLKCTLNLTGDAVANNRGLTHDYIKSEVLGHGHEIANHGYMHRALDSVRPIEGIRETLETRLALEKAFGGIIRGMAYADRSVDRFSQPIIYESVRSYLSQLDIAYARAATSSKSFALPEDWLNWNPTAHHNAPDLFELIDRFVSMDLNQIYCSNRAPKLFFLWGHSFEFESDKNWDRLETICQKLSGHSDIWYATSMDICQYAKAYESLLYSADGSTVYNPTHIELWMDVDQKIVKISPNETVNIQQ